MSDTVTITLDPVEKEALRHETSEPYGHEVRTRLFEKLRAALDATTQPDSSGEAGQDDKHREFDAWLSFRPEFAEVLTAFRSAFGIDTQKAEPEKTCPCGAPYSECRGCEPHEIPQPEAEPGEGKTDRG